MSAEENKRILARGFDAMNKQDLDAFEAVIGEDYVNYSFPDARGREGFRQMIGMFFTAFPDMHVEVADMIAEGDKVASRGTMRGTHKGEFMGIPATGKRIEIGYSDVWRFERGKGVENWVQMDMLGMLQQLGVAPGPGQH
ncbi:MAG: ester cyclase [Thermomicrobiales bacterium]